MKDPLCNFVAGVMDHKDVEDKKQTRGLRRAFGAAGIVLTLIRGLRRAFCKPLNE